MGISLDDCCSVASNESTESSETDPYGIKRLHVYEVDFEADYSKRTTSWVIGAVRLYDIEGLRGSQVDMDYGTFDNTIEVDSGYVPQIDPEC